MCAASIVAWFVRREFRALVTATMTVPPTPTRVAAAAISAASTVGSIPGWYGHGRSTSPRAFAAPGRSMSCIRVAASWCAARGPLRSGPGASGSGRERARRAARLYVPGSRSGTGLGRLMPRARGPEPVSGWRCLIVIAGDWQWPGGPALRGDDETDLAVPRLEAGPPGRRLGHEAGPFDEPPVADAEADDHARDHHGLPGLDHHQVVIAGHGDGAGRAARR